MKNKLVIVLEMIKFEHTILVLPFAYLGGFLAARSLYPGGFPTLTQLLWITLAMFGARTAAMSLNRLIDRQIDARNLRTADRALPAGQLKVFEVCVLIICSFLLLGYAAYQLNFLALKLMPVAIIVLVLYPYTKRFTWACHFVLGIALSLAPMGAWIGITGHWAITTVLLGFGVMIWTAGFDIIYACQDMEFDQGEGLHSIPARFGLTTGLRISAFLHILAPLFLLAVGFLQNLFWFYYLGVAVAVVLLYYQHRIVSDRDLSRVGTAFFNLNGYLSVIIFVFALIDLLMY
ncbi:MAG: putative 4-hydroxybenzoate polyprenyltransferase [Desulfitobacteriaceae bacterium]|nr:putative 4-hydroxybenzoate polyprenyltransferase [Desulfitobacteriaceae bacterium]MDD4346545.1 putative 4-hydroxybenzoate polyprenyltransferase [Desulfitobacteriaceae bacterium]MDD4401821.1 putative 4-hydroxybenzoate polyprenyltransferase [Desulfitobacteriaceae bacterium]